MIGFALALLLSAPPDTLAQRIEEDARALLQTYCEPRCELAGVELELGERPVEAAGTPGFPGEGARAAPVPERVKVEIAYDVGVPKEFRAQLRQLLGLRLKRHKVRPVIRETSFAFPKPLVAPAAKPPPVESRPPEASRAPAPAPAPQIITVPTYLPAPAREPPRAEPRPPRAEPAPPPPVPKPLARLAEEKLVENLPLLAALLLAAIVILVAVRSAGRRPRIAPPVQAAPSAPPEADPGVRGDPLVALAALRAKLEAHPALRRRLVQSLCAERSLDRIARFVQLFGAEALRPERAAQAELFAGVAERLRTLRAPSRTETDELLSDWQSRVAVFELTELEAEELPFDFLRGAEPAALAKALGGLSPGDRCLVLRRASADVRRTYLGTLQSEDGRRLLAALLDARGAEAASAPELGALTERLRDAIRAAEEDARHVHEQAQVLEELLHTRTEAEALEVVETLGETHPALAERVLGQVALEGVAQHCGAEALTTAMLSLEPGLLRTFLAHASDADRALWLGACPTGLRARLTADVERLRQTRPASDAELATSRRAVRAALGATLRARGISLLELNRRAVGASSPEASALRAPALPDTPRQRVGT